MSIGRFGLSVVVVFVVFGAGHSIWPLFFPDITASVEAAMLPMEQQDFGLMMSARFAQTLVIVWIWSKWIASNDLKTGAMYGAAVGVFLAGSDVAYYSMTALPNSVIPVLAVMEIIVAAVACAALAKVYKPAE
jgi:hypothetical protein